MGLLSLRVMSGTICCLAPPYNYAIFCLLLQTFFLVVMGIWYQLFHQSYNGHVIPKQKGKPYL